MSTQICADFFLIDADGALRFMNREKRKKETGLVEANAFRLPSFIPFSLFKE
jgi:hypothetical protein